MIGAMDPAVRRRTMIEGAVGLVLLALAFAAIATSDVSAASSQFYWTLLVIVFAAAALALHWFEGGHGVGGLRGVWSIALHWLGVLVAVEMVFYLVASGRMANADTGLSSGVILALGTYLAGVRGEWRLMVLGVALALATVGVAFVEQYLLVFVGVAVLAVLALIAGARLRRRIGRGAGT